MSESNKNPDSNRPQFHFLPEKNWMNDPNGPIFYKGEYHLFYQYNPEENKWGNIHWGHTKSKDLIYWQRLPIALIPSKERGESHCFSGNCIIHDGVPKIIYTSIASGKPPSIHAEQWLAKGDFKLMKWKKIEDNPILTLKIHKNLEIHDWRDPFIWKENDEFFMICGGHFTQPVQPVVLLYKNLNNLKMWQFIGSLCSGNKKDRKQGKNWECPNFFRLENKHVLIVSPHREVIYCVGDYHNNKFKPSKWKILDHSRNFYATNVLIDEKNRIVLFGWIKVIGKFWSGCLSLPKIIKLYTNNILSFEFHPNLRKLRKDLINSEIFKKSPKNYTLFESQKNLSHEIKMNFNGVQNFELFLTNDSSTSEKQINLIKFDLDKQYTINGKRFIHIKDLTIHIYIDHSVCEIIVGKIYCETKIIEYKQEDRFSLILRVSRGEKTNIQAKIWKIDSIW